MVKITFAISFAILIAKTISANKTQTTLYNHDLINLLYFTLLGLLSSVCRISCSSTNTANNRDTLEVLFAL